MREVKHKGLDVRLTIPDRIRSYFSAEKGAEIYRARAMQAMAGGYIGGDRSRRQTSAWRTRTASADADLLPDLPTLRDRSLDLLRNEPLALGAVNTVITNVVGTGLAVQPQIGRDILAMSETEVEAWQRKTEAEWLLWAEDPSHCDITRKQTFYELQGLAFRSTLACGDVLSLLPHRRRASLPYGLKVQLIEGHRLCNKGHARDTALLAGGVQLDADGAAVAYHIARTHPGDLRRPATEWDVVPAFGERSGRRQVLHLFERRRPRQNRGEPYLAPVIEPLKQLGRYTEAEIMAAVISGMFTVFVTSDGPGLDPVNQQALGAETGAKEGDKDIKMASGAIIDLGGGKVEFANPGRPNTAFDPFVQAVLRQIGGALELPFEILIKHYTASYSAARAAMLDAWRFFRVRREWLVMNFCQPVYEAWMDEAVASGRISAPGYFGNPLIRKAYLGTQWTGDGPGSIDPLKEVNAAEKRMDLTLTTLADETMAYDGGDYRKRIAQRGRELRLKREAGLVPVAQVQTSAPSAPEEPNQDKPDTERE